MIISIDLTIGKQERTEGNENRVFPGEHCDHEAVEAVLRQRYPVETLIVAHDLYRTAEAGEHAAKQLGDNQASGHVDAGILREVLVVAADADAHAKGG